MLVYNNTPGGFGFVPSSLLFSSNTRPVKKEINKKVIKHPFHLTIAKKRAQKSVSNAVMPSVLLNDLAEKSIPDWRQVTIRVPNVTRLLDVNESRAAKAEIFNSEVLHNKDISPVAKKFLRKMVNEFSFSDNLAPIEIPLERQLERYRLLSGGHDLESELRDRRIIRDRPEPLKDVLDDVFNSTNIKRAVASGYTPDEIGDIVKKLYNTTEADEKEIIREMDKKYKAELEKRRQTKLNEEMKKREAELAKREREAISRTALMPELGSSSQQQPILTLTEDNSYDPNYSDLNAGLMPFTEDDIEYARSEDGAASDVADNMAPFTSGPQVLDMIREQMAQTALPANEMDQLSPPLETTEGYGENDTPEQLAPELVDSDIDPEPVYTGQPVNQPPTKLIQQAVDTEMPDEEDDAENTFESNEVEPSAPSAPAQINTDLAVGNVPLEITPQLKGTHEAAVDGAALALSQIKETDPATSVPTVLSTIAPKTRTLSKEEKQIEDFDKSRLMRIIHEKQEIDAIRTSGKKITKAREDNFTINRTREYLNAPPMPNTESFNADDIKAHIRHVIRYNTTQERFQGIPAAHYRSSVDFLSDQYEPFDKIKDKLIGTVQKSGKLKLIDKAIDEIDSDLKTDIKKDMRDYMDHSAAIAEQLFDKPSYLLYPS